MTQTVTLEKVGPMSLSPSNTQIRKSSAFTPRVRPIALRRWSLSGKGASLLWRHRARRGAWIEAAS